MSQIINSGNQAEIAFVLDDLHDIPALLAAMPESVAVAVLNHRGNALQQMADFLADYSLGSISAIHLFSHGSSGRIDFGASSLNSANLPQYGQELAAIGKSLNPDGDFFIYGCDVAKGQTGREFINAFAWATGGDIAASDDLTGAGGLGGGLGSGAACWSGEPFRTGIFGLRRCACRNHHLKFCNRFWRTC